MSENDASSVNTGGIQRLWLVVLPFIMMLIVGLFVRSAFLDLAHWIGSYSWDVTEGRLEEVDVETESVDEVRWKYRPDVRYTYSVDGQDYTGTRLYFGNEPNAYSEWVVVVDLSVASYEESSSVNVYYNPDDPEQSVIERRPGPERGYQWIFVTLIILVLIGYVLAIVQIVFTMVKNLFKQQSD